MSPKLINRSISDSESNSKMRAARNHRSSLAETALIGFHELLNFLGKLSYNQIRKIEYTVPKEEAIKNMEKIAKRIIEFIPRKNKSCWWSDEETETPEKSKGESKRSLEERLNTLGTDYIEYEELQNIPEDSALKFAREYDWKGIIPEKNEKPSDFVYRANTLLFIHKAFKDHKVFPRVTQEEGYDVDLRVDHLSARTVSKEDIAEANKRIPYHMDLSWVAAFVCSKHEFSGVLNVAYGACFTLPKYNGISFVIMRERYKKRKYYIKVLAHELTHVGTVFLDTRKDFVETKAYISGSAAIGEYTIALNKRPGIGLRAINFLLRYVSPYKVPDFIITAIPIVKSAIDIADHRLTFQKVKKELTQFYGNERANYVIGRLSAEEVEEFAYTNSIPARIAMKDDLKWKVMKENVEQIDTTTGQGSQPD